MNTTTEALKLAHNFCEELTNLCGKYPYINGTEVVRDAYKVSSAIREALAEPELNLNCKSVQARLATVWGYVKAEPVKQEPVAWHEPNAYGNVTTHKKWAEENGWLPLYTKE